MADQLDLTDVAAVKRWATDLQVAYEDVAAVAEDLLRPLRQRDLGHVEHQRLYRDANEKVTQLFAYAGVPGEGDASAAPNDDASATGGAR